MNEIKKKKIGIMGGTFNPIHFGHILIAQSAFEQFSLHKVWFMPNKIPAYKSIKDIVDEKHRVEMVSIAIEQYDNFELSEFELQRDGYTYTYDTLLRLKEEYENYEFYFIMGADSLFTFSKWVKPDIIAQNCTLLVAGRDNAGDKKIDNKMQELRQQYHAEIFKINCNEVDISSNSIRKKIKNNDEITSFMPQNVIEYIKKYNLYEY